MIAYSVNLLGGGNYLVTEKQKVVIEQAMASGTNETITINGDVFRKSQVKSITYVEIELKDAPEYFRIRLSAENEKKGGAQNYRNLPTSWIILDSNFKIIETNMGRKTVRRVSEALAKIGDPKENERLHFYLAKCHYTIGTNGERQYFAALGQIAEAIKCIPCGEDIDGMIATKVYRYGLPTGKNE